MAATLGTRRIKKAANQELVVDASDQSGIQVPILRNDSD
jgi:hypothetical protein